MPRATAPAAEPVNAPRRTTENEGLAGRTVVIGEGKRPETATTVTLDSFEGPLGLLLSLIESRQLDVLTVPLGLVAGAYLDALATLEADRIGNISAFVAIAGQLILIKSRAMLPGRAGAAERPEDAPDPEEELRARLLLYRAYRDAGRRLQDVALAGTGIFRREPTVALTSARAGAIPAPAVPLDAALLAASLERVFRVIPDPPPPPEAFGRAITISERAAVIRAALRGASTVVLQDLLQGVRNRIVAVVTFLSMLELMKRREIVAVQDRPWGPIVIRATTADERTGGTALTVDEPIDETLASFA